MFGRKYYYGKSEKKELDMNITSSFYSTYLHLTY